MADSLDLSAPLDGTGRDFELICTAARTSGRALGQVAIPWTLSSMLVTRPVISATSMPVVFAAHFQCRHAAGLDAVARAPARRCWATTVQPSSCWRAFQPGSGIDRVANQGDFLALHGAGLHSVTLACRPRQWQTAAAPFGKAVDQPAAEFVGGQCRGQRRRHGPSRRRDGRGGLGLREHGPSGRHQ